jgi:glc operon protein GlcG
MSPRSVLTCLIAVSLTLRLMSLQGIVPSIGGIPLVVDGKIVGAIGVSGGTGPQDGQCAQAGADALK